MKAAKNKKKEVSQGDLPGSSSRPTSSDVVRAPQDAPHRAQDAPHRAQDVPHPAQDAPHPAQDAPLPAESINVAPQPEEEQSSNPRTAAVDFQTALELLRAPDASMVDYEREWNEIEAEERRVRTELDQALPGDPLLGPATSSQQPSPLPEIPFEMVTTRYGTLCHSNQNCRYLTAPMTGAAKIHKWCATCRMEAAQTGIIPGRGAAVLMVGWRIDFHTDIMCIHAAGANSFSLCTACLEYTQVA